MLRPDIMLKAAGALLLGASLILPMACRRTDGSERAQGPDSRKSEPPVRPVIDLTPGSVPNSRFESDALWQRASKGEEIDLLRVAQREGAAGLLEAVEAGRSPALTALAALPYADDAELALARLCELAHAMGKNPAQPLVAAIQGIVAEPPNQREPFSVAGYAECLPVMQRIAKLPALDSKRHDLASSATELLIEHRDAAKH